MIRSIAASLLFAISLSATVTNVPDDQATIQAGIDVSVDGDTVLVQPGTYVENINFNGKNIVVGSLYIITLDTTYISQTVINGNQNASVVTFEGSEDTTCTLAGVTIINGLSTDGGGLFIKGNPSIKYCNITQNYAANHGGGIYIWFNSNPVLGNLNVTNNEVGSETGWGGGIWSFGQGVLNNSTVSGNIGWIAGVGGQGGNPSITIDACSILNNVGTGVCYYISESNTIRNTIIAGNSGEGIYLMSSNGSLVANSTVSENHMNGILCSGLNNEVINSIIWDNSHGIYDNIENITVTYSIIQDEWIGVGNLTSDPMFDIDGTADYKISNYSPAIGGGIFTSAISNTDIDGNPRPNPAGSNPDIGAYESPLATPQHIPITINIPDDYATIQAGLNAAEEGDTVLVQPGTYYENIIWPHTANLMVAGAGNQSECIVDGQNFGSVIHCDSVQATISDLTLQNGGNVQYGGGIYVSGGNLSLYNLAIINSTSSIKAGGIYIADSAIVIIENIVFENNYRNDIYSDHSTIQIFSSIITNGSIEFRYSESLIINCAFEGSSISQSHGTMSVSQSDFNNHDARFIIASYGDISISVCEFNNSTGLNGGAITLNGMECEISQSAFANNSSSSAGGAVKVINGSVFNCSSTSFIDNAVGSYSGGAIWVEDSEVQIDSCIVTGNVAAGEGGGIGLNGCNSVYITNCDIFENSGRNGGGIYSNSSTNTFTNCNIHENTAREDGGGLAIYNGTSTIQECLLFINNAADKGGAVFSTGELHFFQYLQLIENEAEVGGAFYGEFGTILNSLFYNNRAVTVPGVYATSSASAINNSNLKNLGYSVFTNDNSGYLDARNNWWGVATGPYHPTQNPAGQGDSTNQWVNVNPLMTTADIDAPPIQAQNVSVSGTGNDFIILEWSSSPLGDFAGFKLYYDTDESGYPYENSIDIGSNTSYALSGLNLGTEYFLAVTVYDTDGNESWYSQEVTGTTRVMEVQNLDIAGEEELLHLVTQDPLITFDYFDSMGEAQTNYHVQISTDSTFQSNLIWDSGEVASDATSVQYTEGLLENGVTYNLRAKVASGAFWSNWSTLTFRMNSEPILPIQVSLIANEVTTDDVVLEIMNSSDAENDNLTYDFRLYDATQTTQLDSAIAVTEVPEGTIWEVTTALDDNAQHWWTVQAYDGYEYSELAGPASFLINFENDIPAGFSLTSPLASEAITSQSPLFTWDRAIDMDPLDTVRYVLYLDTPEPGTLTFDIDTDTSFQFLDVLEDNTSYHWKVTAHDVAGAMTTNIGGYQSFTVNTSNDLPTAFTLLSPDNNAMVNTLTPEFLWEASSDPDDETIVMRNMDNGRKADHSSTGDNSVMVITGYEFNLGLEADLSDAIALEVLGTSYSPETELLENAIYYWAVTALDDSGGVTSSDTASFWTNSVNEAPAVFSLISPAEDEVVTVLMPSFVWASSSDADLYDEFEYKLVLGTHPDAMDTIWTGMDTSLVLAWELEDNTTWYWVVYAEDSDGLVTQNTGGYQSFTVNASNDLPTAFNLLSPIADMMVTTLTPEFLWQASSDPDDETILMRSSGKDLKADHLNGIDNTVMVITGYNFYLSTDAGLADATPVEVIGTSYVPTEELLENQIYYWAVSALDDSGGVTFSDTASFWTNSQNDLPAAFSMLNPVGLPLLGLPTLTPTFTWTSSSDADLNDELIYRLQLGTSTWDMHEVYVGSESSWTPTETLWDNTVYSWQVLAEDLSGAITIAGIGDSAAFTHFYTNVENENPDPAILLSPDSVVVLTDTPTFIWERSFDPDPFEMVNYEVHWWYEGSEWDSILTEETSVTISNPLAEDNKQYFWQVISMDDEGGLAQSQDFMFWVDFLPEPPGTFALLGPEDESAGNSTRPELTWEPSLDPDPFDNVSYQIALSTDSNMVDIVYEGSALPEGHIPDVDLQNDTRYYWQVSAHDEDSLQTLSEVWTFDVGYLALDNGIELPTEYALNQNYPNPFNPSTTIRYGLPEEANVSLVIYDVRGQVVQTLESEHQSAGWYDVVWNGQTADGKTISTGIYFARLVAGDYSQVVKMLYLK